MEFLGNVLGILLISGIAGFFCYFGFKYRNKKPSSKGKGSTPKTPKTPEKY